MQGIRVSNSTEGKDDTIECRFFSSIGLKTSISLDQKSPTNWGVSSLFLSNEVAFVHRAIPPQLTKNSRVFIQLFQMCDSQVCSPLTF
jgi:hypothetical protein